MIIVKLQGGLGNQMFQYAFAKSTANYFKTGFCLDTDFLLDRSLDGKGENFVFRDFDLEIFDLEIPLAKANIEKDYPEPGSNKKNIFSWTAKRKYYHEQTFAFDKGVYQQNRNTYFNGYWQTEKYFAGIEQAIRSDFTFQHAILESSSELLNLINDTNSVCINFRRQDYLVNNFHGVIGPDYYIRAISYLSKNIKAPHFFVFADDIEWCRENFTTDHPFCIVDHSHKGRKFGNYLALMQSCKNFIVPNSSFAWWAAWLHNNPEKIVIAPKTWLIKPDIDTSDIIPAEWIKL